MRQIAGWVVALVCLVSSVAVSLADAPSWEHAGWGGGGFYWAAAFDPSQDGVIYLAGDVGGVYKSIDHGKIWKPINNGLSSYGVFSLAVDRTNPQTVYAAGLDGLCKTTDGGDHWQALPHTGPKELRITGERNRSVRSIAVDPTNGNIVYAGTPAGKIYKTVDAGVTWNQVYETGTASPKSMVVRFGKVNQEWFGVFSTVVSVPTDVQPGDCGGIGLAFRGDGNPPRDAYITLKTSDGGVYRSKNVRSLFERSEWQDVLITADDIEIDPEFAAKHADKAAALPKTPIWNQVNQIAISCVGPLMNKQSVAEIKSLFLILNRPTTQPSGAAIHSADATRRVLRDFTKDGKGVQSFGNAKAAVPAAGPVMSVAIAEKNPSMIVAATDGEGVLISLDAGATWKPLATPEKVASVAIAATDPNILFAACQTDGLLKSTNQGVSWTRLGEGIDEKVSMLDVAISPLNPQDVYAIANVKQTWVGYFYSSNDGGKTWKESSKLKPDNEFNPTQIDNAKEVGTVRMSLLSNLALNPSNPQELFIAGNWRSPWSNDGGRTWIERLRGADISCITDIRFKGERAYVSAMDEGVFAGDKDGKNWRQLWPLGHSPTLSGHYWQLAITENDGADRILSTCSPWDAKLPNRLVISEDGGETFKQAFAGLPDYRPNINVMWGISYPRAMAVDPNNPKVVYLGIDGDAAPGKSGGGIFRSDDGGYNWKQLPNQPGSRRMFYGLAVDPSNSKRLFWGACATNGGVYRSEDGGDTWENVFTGTSWVFNIKITPSGTIFCAGTTGLWRSTDHGQSWNQLGGKFGLKGSPPVIGLEIDPRDEKTIWVSGGPSSEAVGGGVYKTTDGGVTWEDITSDLPYLKPMVLRFNPATNDLWAGHVGLYKIRQ